MIHCARRVLVPAALSAFAAALLLVGGCASNDKVDPPAELVKLKATVKVEKAWSLSVGGAKPALRLGLGVAVADNRAFVASHKGDVLAVSLANGKTLWRTRTKLPLSGGPGVGDGLVVAGAGHGDVVALDAATGTIRWKTRVNSEVLSAPAIGAGLVVLRTVDGRLHALQASDGALVWAVEQKLPRLSLRGAAMPVIVGDAALCGYDNGRVLAVSLKDGATLWESTVAPPSGRTELERLVDIDSALHVIEDDVYAVSFQGRAVRLARDSGQLWWAHDLSSFRGMTVDADGLYVSTSDGQVVKIARQTGVEVWRQDMLRNRNLSAPVLLGGQVAVADYKGYVHFFDRGTGALTERLSGGGKVVSNAPVAAGDLALFMNDKGQLSAYRLAKSRR